MSEDSRRLLARVVLPKDGDCYAGACPLFGFAYYHEVRKHPDGIEVSVFDGPAVGAYRVPSDDAP